MRYDDANEQGDAKQSVNSKKTNFKNVKGIFYFVANKTIYHEKESTAVAGICIV